VTRGIVAGLLLLAACAGPKPCTRTLCVYKLDGTMELSGWSGSIKQSASTPKAPVMADSVVTILDGSAEFLNGKTRVAAGAGSSFKFFVSTRAVASIEVSSGPVTVTPPSGAAVALTPGAPYPLPKPQ